MTKRRRQHLLPGAVLAASAALVAIGCSGSGDTGTGVDSTEGATNDAVTLDGVRFDVRRDPG